MCLAHLEAPHSISSSHVRQSTNQPSVARQTMPRHRPVCGGDSLLKRHFDSRPSHQCRGPLARAFVGTSTLSHAMAMLGSQVHMSVAASLDPSPRWPCSVQPGLQCGTVLLADARTESPSRLPDVCRSGCLLCIGIPTRTPLVHRFSTRSVRWIRQRAGLGDEAGGRYVQHKLDTFSGIHTNKLTGTVAARLEVDGASWSVAEDT